MICFRLNSCSDWLHIPQLNLSPLWIKVDLVGLCFMIMTVIWMLENQGFKGTNVHNIHISSSYVNVA